MTPLPAGHLGRRRGRFDPIVQAFAVKEKPGGIGERSDAVL
jgi:hypothetical protein